MKKHYWIYAFIVSGGFMIALVILWCVGMCNTDLSGSIPWGLYLAYAFLVGAVGSFTSGIIIWSIHLFRTHRFSRLPFAGALIFLMASFVTYVIGLIYPSLERTWSMIHFFLVGAAVCLALGLILLIISGEKSESGNK